MLDTNYTDPLTAAWELLGRPGAMLSGSKTAAPERRVVWNANVLIDQPNGKFSIFPAKRVSPVKVWFGDLSITESEAKLQELANRFGQKVYVLREMDARFDTEANPRIDEAVAVFEPESDDA